MNVCDLPRGSAGQRSQALHLTIGRMQAGHDKNTRATIIGRRHAGFAAGERLPSELGRRAMLQAPWRGRRSLMCSRSIRCPYVIVIIIHRSHRPGGHSVDSSGHGQSISVDISPYQSIECERSRQTRQTRQMQQMQQMQQNDSLRLAM